MLLVYSLKLKSIHFKYLLLGVLAFLDLIKKKEHLALIGIQSKKKKKKLRKYTVLKSPFSNKKAREQFKLQLHTIVILFSVGVGACSFFYLERFVDVTLLKYLSSQYLEAKLVKKYKLNNC
jgi:hypothetical protein